MDDERRLPRRPRALGDLPAPLIIFGTFVGYVGGSPLGALVMTVGIFAPGLRLHRRDHLERAIQHRAARTFLYRVTAGVVGLISATTVNLLGGALTDRAALGIFAAALALLYAWQVKASMGSRFRAGALGFFLFRPDPYARRRFWALPARRRTDPGDLTFPLGGGFSLTSALQCDRRCVTDDDQAPAQVAEGQS